MLLSNHVHDKTKIHFGKLIFLSEKNQSFSRGLAPIYNKGIVQKTAQINSLRLMFDESPQ